MTRELKPYRIVPKWSPLLECTVFRVYHSGYSIVPLFSAASIAMAMTFIEKYIRGELIEESHWAERAKREWDKRIVRGS